MSFWKRFWLYLNPAARAAYEADFKAEMLRLIHDAPDEPVTFA